MRTLYLFVTDTLSDWEPGNVLAELRSGRYLKDPALKYHVVLCGRTMEPITTMGGIRMVPEVLISDIRPVPDDVLILPGADTWLDPFQKPVIGKVKRTPRSWNGCCSDLRGNARSCQCRPAGQPPAYEQ